MAPARPVLVDATRLLTRLRHRHPTGIDRVDLAYARRYLARPEDGAVALTRFGARILPAERSRDLLARLEARWRETVPAAADPVLAGIRRRLAGEPRGAPTVPAGRGLRLPSVHVEAERLLLGAPLWRAAAAAPQGCVYLHTSHLRLDRPGLFAWLDRRPDIRPVFFVHDLIPIDYPEYGVPGEADRHRTRMATVARRAAAVIVNSDDVGSRLAAHLRREGLPVPSITTAPLGVETAFQGGLAAPSAGAGAPYFVACSTIEARKNHLLLLQVWRELAERLGPAVPKLVVVGRRGWESEAAADLLDRCPALREPVIEAASLSSAGLAELVAGARALLMPSFAEGYGIPVVEALSLGTPVIASDIPAHREVAGGHATFLHPLDGTGWRDAVLAAAGRPRDTVERYAPPTWEAHFAIADDVLARL
ncbi:MAG: glycosyltransferase family 4 protein [Methylobacteriaceae bacterium]|nr:glycosyltransferase family 4 protein [Methylobacteriaceae bacterium]